MSLVLLNPGREPLGQFDALSTLIPTVKGGEVLTFTSAAISSQSWPADAADGYLYGGTTRPLLSLASTTTVSPFMLCDDGLAGYGTIFGQIVGGTVGTVVNTGAQLGPATGTASGRLTAWDKSGMYGITLDSLNANVQPTVSITVGAPLYVDGSGLLTTTRVSSQPQIASFIEFRSKGSLVNTPNRLVSALNSPSSVVGGVLPTQVYMGVVHFSPNT